MKAHKVLGLVLLVSVLFFAMAQCHSEGRVVYINLDEAKENNDLSIYEGLMHIKLPPDVYISENYISAYHDEGGVLSLYDEGGNFLNHITSLGLSEEECSAIFACHIDEIEGLIYVLDWRKVKKYSLKGEYIGSFNIALSDGMVLLPNGLLLLHNIVEYIRSAANSFVLYDGLGVEHRSYPNTIPFVFSSKVTSLYLSDFASYAFERNVYVKDRGDTIFRVQDTFLQPAYIFAGAHSLPDVISSGNTYRQTYRTLCMAETPSSLLFETKDNDDQIRQWCFDKKRHLLFFTQGLASGTISLPLLSTPSLAFPSSSVSSKILTETINGINFNMIPVPSGMYIRYIDAGVDSTYIHLNNYYIGETEVSHAQWKVVMGDYHASYEQNDQHPVTKVSWLEAWQFIDQLNKISERSFRLPTEAEWEYAAGGAQIRPSQWSGTDDIDELANYAHIYEKSSSPVKSKRPNRLGIYDMTGNVQEWCSDWYNPYPKAARSLKNPQGGSNGLMRVIKGGSFGDITNYYLNIEQRSGMYMEVYFGMLGFRLAMNTE